MRASAKLRNGQRFLAAPSCFPNDVVHAGREDCYCTANASTDAATFTDTATFTATITKTAITNVDIAAHTNIDTADTNTDTATFTDTITNTGIGICAYTHAGANAKLNSNINTYIVVRFPCFDYT